MRGGRKRWRVRKARENGCNGKRVHRGHGRWRGEQEVEIAVGAVKGNGGERVGMIGEE